ncbi:MAG: thiamine-phosphate kinase [Aeromonadaceae bacterium]|jgi:thiamine-monophosphate kinase|nr:thiamine-phosphate kinase [Aeromonadaceae bacterium]MBP8772731.1 thiamine-phosphate kinase [Aeromonadaceae bacterium]
MGEFELIRRYFQRPVRRKDVVLGSGDDCALLSVPADALLAVSTDTLVAGVHFFADMDPRKLGHKALAVNLSDLAAMGAEPRWVSLALTLPEVNESWVAAFAEGFLALADFYNVELIGGDMTRGPLSMTVSIKGVVPEQCALRRNGAQPGDAIFVTGTLGDGALALQHCLGKLQVASDELPGLMQKLEQPQPRILAGMALRNLASSCLDISDGLSSDLQHILVASGVGAQIELSQLPLSPALEELPATQAWQLALAGGDDYELCFTLPEAHRGALLLALQAASVTVTEIGRIVAGEPLIQWLEQGQPRLLTLQGWDHFQAPTV